ncbi:MAG: phage tail protein, partial [Anaerovoracaceae bacterium]
MADNFGLKIGVEGEKDFKKALSDINQQFKVLGSEMKLATSQFDKNESGVQSLTAKNEVLTKQIDTQKSKIETLRSALQNASDSFGENDKRTQQWVIALNNAEAELNG